MGYKDISGQLEINKTHVIKPSVQDVFEGIEYAKDDERLFLP